MEATFFCEKPRIEPRNSSWITKVRASSWRTWQNTKSLITTEVTTTFCISPCTPISYTSFLRPTAVSRLNSPTIRLNRSKYPTQTSTSSRRSLISDSLLETAVESLKFWVGFACRYSDFECREIGRNTALAMKGLFAFNSSLLTVPWNVSARCTVGKFEPFKIRIFKSERTRQSEGVSPRVFWRGGYPCLCELKG